MGWKGPGCSDLPCLPSVQCFGLSACPQWSNTHRCLVLSTFWSLWFPLWTVYFGIGWLLQTSCAGEWKPNEPNRHVAEFRSWPLKWRFPWDSTGVMSDIRSYCSGHQAAGEQTFHFSAAKRGEFPSETHSRHHIVYLAREWCNGAERG